MKTDAGTTNPRSNAWTVIVVVVTASYVTPRPLMTVSTVPSPRAKTPRAAAIPASSPTAAHKAAMPILESRRITDASSLISRAPKTML